MQIQRDAEELAPALQLDQPVGLALRGALGKRQSARLREDDAVVHRLCRHGRSMALGDGGEALVAEVSRRQLTNVVFAPPQPKENMASVWSLCDVALVHLRDSPVFAEVIPSKMFEAMAMGVPVVLKEGALFHMWYEAKDFNNVFQIGSVSSPDGVHWVRRSPNVSVWQGAQDASTDLSPHYVWASDVLKDGTAYRLYYSTTIQPAAVRIGQAVMSPGALLTQTSASASGTVYTVSVRTGVAIPAGGSVLLSFPGGTPPGVSAVGIGGFAAGASVAYDAVDKGIVEAGYAWTILDDAHFRAASIDEEGLWGAYTTEDQGRRLTVFGTGQGLRYRIPFGEVDDVIAYLRSHATEAGDRLGMMGDDGEKFGAWPTTWEHCWGTGRWVERFFSALEAESSWLTTVTPTSWLDAHPPIGRVYLPTGSYAEMGEWALPAEDGAAFTSLLHDAVAAGRPEARWLRGGFWRNFQVKYREVNDLHKQMLRTSAKVEAMPAGPVRERALDHLHRGQSNDCYWHGLFGGVYITHMRLATLEHLIAAEDIADGTYRRSNAGTTQPALLADLDLDGTVELQLAHAGARLQIDPNEGGAITAIDLRAPHHALLAVMRRRPEAYHEKLRAHAATVAAGGASSGTTEGGVASIHDIVSVKEPGLAARLKYDRDERRSALLRLYPAGTRGRAVADGDAIAIGSFAATPWTLTGHDDRSATLSASQQVAGTTVAATRTIRLTGGRLDPTIEVETVLTQIGRAHV